MSVPEPTPATRWRCAQCGNLTRFDVTRTTRAVEYVHVDLAGEAKVEERKILRDELESVRCRWCNTADQVELVERPGAEPFNESDDPGADTASRTSGEA
ncbi:hypothetical protein [Allostreptomyces psammosilenae]|uniref:Uncharacterized protein n=1 Tax=Allostreptomyces psammosilenae TaxID=1892865 RepID=A0A852ZY98_9ACTN|nr:hypothetical protein [Allostreptomyces psammosilenae]NYI07035.1 hypothetical protein [Allostreptomyces psammosilenae]